jgi:phosphatidylserine/phosphatidylglycerophosphate/cardiolipin synthase-like enzyme
MTGWPAAADEIAGYPYFEIVESAPVETSLDHPDIRNAHEAWLEMIRGARRTLDFAEFYASSEPAEPLEDIVREIEAAAERGVRVRFLSAASFYPTYPATIDRLAKKTGIETRLLDLSSRSGGVLHAKYFIIDEEEVFLGSQNFDWRALEHILEIGVRVQDSVFVEPFKELFERDWTMAGAAGAFSTPGPPAWADRVFPRPRPRVSSTGDSIAFFPVMSPRGWIPDSTLWDEPQLVELIDGAKETVSVQLLTYRPVSDGEHYDVLESALRRAAARGVRVRLLVSDWCKRESTVPYIQSLALVPNLEVRMVTIPQSSGGFIPYARVIHAKTLVADGRSAWIGTSNWEKDYFHASRNVGVIVRSELIGEVLLRVFEDTWTSPYAYAVDPCADYDAPRISE